MRTDGTDDMVRARYRAAKREPWGLHSLHLVTDLLVEMDQVYGHASDYFQGQLGNALGFWRRIPGTAWYRPCRGAATENPTDAEKAWKLVELRDLVMRVRRGDQF